MRKPTVQPRPGQSRAAAGAEDLAEFLRGETTGGKLLLAATAVALAWATLFEGSYRDVWSAHAALGPDWLHLDLTLGEWAADGLLAIFFFVAGLELKRELVVGELSNRRAATLPMFAAVGGMVLPALLALAVSRGAAADGGAWAIPVATDIAFALGVLALAGAALPPGVRTLLLSMAVVDDLLAITLIALLFSAGLSPAWLAGAAAAAAVYWLALRRELDSPWVLWGLAVIVWVCVHAGGVHATVAGVLLGLLTPVRPRAGGREAPGPRMEHRLHPISAGVAVPIFALAAAGIPLSAVGEAIDDKVALGVFAGLLVGKVAGILGGAYAAVRMGLGSLPERVGWADVVPVAVLGGIGYTVSLLIAGLALPEAAAERSAAAILVAAVFASALAVFLLRRRSRAH